MSEIKPDEVYTTQEARDFLKVSESTLKRFLKKGIINARKVGGRYKILGSELLELVSPSVHDRVHQLYHRLRNKAEKAISKW